MVRHFIKGGVWKNSEDEILKAAVMKYGKQQWARVASLLNRKSAKQCKARWHEWLDPSVKKVEWSREEEEKLLHLAKLMPSQWKSIGPLVGRTAAQSQERYEALLDEAAAAAAASADGTENSTEAAISAAAGLRRHTLRPGEVDTHPETRPARPDPIDMDEDEIEMLQEARARLANTQGKKAKRKQREKMLQEAKRLAELQKRRELKQAGLISRAMRTRRKRSKKGRREIDYGVEIPFHKPAPAGFHSVAEEKEKTEEIRLERLKNVNYRRINENQFKSRDREAALAKKREEARMRTLERANAALAMAKENEKKKNEVNVSHKRVTLSLPEPMKTDSELENAAKEDNTDSALMPPPSKRGKPTDTLLGDYTDRALPTPMRTPASQSISTRESVLKEANNLRMLETGQTPLLGGDNPDLNPSDAASTATPQIGMESTPLQRKQMNATPSSVATRDQLGLNHTKSNNDDASSVASSFYTAQSLSAKEIAREERRALKRARKELEEALASLPAPQFEYELAAPNVVSEEDETEKPVVIEKDAADIEKERLKRIEQEAAKLYEARSTVVKREDLPRPPVQPNEQAISMFVEQQKSDAKSLILTETLKLMEYDLHTHPIKPAVEDFPIDNSKKKRKKKRGKDEAFSSPLPLDLIPHEQLNAAKELLKQEVLNFEKCDAQNSTNCMLFMQDEEDDKSARWQIFPSESVTQEHRIAAMKLEYQTLLSYYESQCKKNGKLEAKLELKNGGYVKRSNAISDAAADTHAELLTSCIEEDVYSRLLRMEEQSIPKRLNGLKREVEELQEKEKNAQKYYGDLIHDRSRCLAALKNNA